MKPHSSWRSDLQGLQTNIISYIYITSINFTKSPRPVFLATWEPVGDHRRLNEPGAEKTVSQHRTGTGQRATWTGGKKGKDKGKGKGKRRLVPDLCATCGLVPEKGGGGLGPMRCESGGSRLRACGWLGRVKAGTSAGVTVQVSPPLEKRHLGDVWCFFLASQGDDQMNQAKKITVVSE